MLNFNLLFTDLVLEIIIKIIYIFFVIFFNFKGFNSKYHYKIFNNLSTLILKIFHLIINIHLF